MATAKKKTAAKAYVVVRTYSAGVHCGELVSREGREVTLHDARRIWRWAGANTINEVAMSGVAASSRVSVPVTEIVLTEAIEIVTCSADGEANLRAAAWTK